MLRIDGKIPFIFQVAQNRIATNKHGGYRLASILEGLHQKFGILSCCAPFPLSGGGSLLMPLYWPLLLHKDRIRNYEIHQIDAFSRAVDGLGGDVTLVDCGADVGLFTRLVLQKSKSIGLVHAFEPN